MVKNGKWRKIEERCASRLIDHSIGTRRRLITQTDGAYAMVKNRKWKKWKSGVPKA